MTATLRMILVSSIAIALAFAGDASAQTSKPSAKKHKQLVVGGLFAGPSSVGTAAAELLNGSGDPSVTLFRVENKLAAGLGVEANLGFQLSQSLWAEVSGGWTRSNVESEIR